MTFDFGTILRNFAHLWGNNC